MRREFKSFLVAIFASLVFALAGVSVSAGNSDVITQTLLAGAAINGQTPKGVAEHRANADGSRRFKVEVEDVNLPAGTILNVFVNGASIGSLTLDSFRNGELELESNDGEIVPTINAGTTVEVRTQAGAAVVSGTFTAAAPSPTATPTPSPIASPTPTPSPNPNEGQKSAVQFDAPAYTVAEDARSVTVTVTRTGDTSRDFKVDYRSIDGSAYERTDYTTAWGRLFFAPNETMKTITVLITDDGFAEGDETFALMLNDASHSTAIGNPGITTITIKDNDTATANVNPIDQNRSFIIQHYMDFLNREPEPEGLRAWEDILNKCEPGDNKCDRIEVSSAFFRSREFQTRGYFLYRFYSTALGRVPHYAEFEKDMSRTSGFQTEAEQEANRALFADDFVTRQEFKDRYDQFTTASAYVNALLATAGVTVGNKDALIAVLESGQATRAQVLRAISESPEVSQKFYTESFVVQQYFGYLRRDPDILYLEWIRIMNQNPGAYRDMINGFMSSVEYRGRFGR